MTLDVRDSLREIVREALSALLGPDTPLADTVANADAAVYEARVVLTGASQGLMSVRVTPGLARTLAAAMLGCRADQVTDADIRDAVAELASVTSANVKSLFPGPSDLALPATVVGPGVTARSGLGGTVAEVAFATGGKDLTVARLELRLP